MLDTTYCGVGTFKCKDGTCYPSRKGYKCLEDDCYLSKDLLCENKIQCYWSKHDICDGENDCDDGTDEFDCPPKPRSSYTTPFLVPILTAIVLIIMLCIWIVLKRKRHAMENQGYSSASPIDIQHRPATQSVNIQMPQSTHHNPDDTSQTNLPPTCPDEQDQDQSLQPQPDAPADLPPSYNEAMNYPQTR